MARILLSSQRFTISQIENFRERFPEGKVIVHPECEAEVVNAADSNGSTQFIKNYVESMPEDQKLESEPRLIWLQGLLKNILIST